MKHSNGLVCFLIIAFITLSSCGQRNKDVPLHEIDVELDFQRTDLSMTRASNFAAQDSSVSDSALYNRFLKPHRNFWVSHLYLGRDSLISDSIIAEDLGSFLRNEYVNELLQVTADSFPEEYPFEDSLINPFKRLKHYFPDMKTPRLRTYVSGYSQKGERSIDQVWVSGDFEYCALGLHYFLGPDFKYYPPDIPGHVRRKFTPAHLETTLFSEIARMLSSPPSQNPPVLLEAMINSGKRLYFLDKILPYTHDTTKIYYSLKQLQWAYYYEANIYKLLQPHLYENEPTILQNYLGEKPYTTELSLESAPRIGEFAGWMIVHEYMAKNPDITLPELMKETDYEKILRESSYKPEPTE